MQYSSSFILLYSRGEERWSRHAPLLCLFCAQIVAQNSNKNKNCSASGRISQRTLSSESHGDDAATTLMAGYVAFRAERCDMQAFTPTVCHTHICIHSVWRTPQGLPLITADLCTFRLWNDGTTDLRTPYHNSLHLFSFHLSFWWNHVSAISPPFLLQFRRKWCSNPVFFFLAVVFLFCFCILLSRHAPKSVFLFKLHFCFNLTLNLKNGSWITFRFTPRCTGLQGLLPGGPVFVQNPT